MPQVDDSVPLPRQPRGPSRGCWGCLVTVAILAYGLFRGVNPSDWVDVTFEGMPPARGGYYLVADTPGGMEVMPEYHSKVFPFDDPVRLLHQRDRLGAGGTEIDSVRWIEGRRYGLLARLEDRRWRIWWLGPNDLRGPLIFRYIVGGGSAWVRAPAVEKGEILSDEAVQRLDPTSEVNAVRRR
jgi:hypothetical protein